MAPARGPETRSSLLLDDLLTSLLTNTYDDLFLISYSALTAIAAPLGLSVLNEYFACLLGICIIYTSDIQEQHTARPLLCSQTALNMEKHV